ncbi:SA1362 family protein [Thalassobacillus sp. CUG 92003]|uniref:SA1362 family protein n=1 Tax=Thalassobacillus sp. CUG 92003 TaxID=2736641 RepID=UPI0015E7D04D|nr:SA1362 family protein [Thalassobacillus sp. CUG 92003]
MTRSRLTPVIYILMALAVFGVGVQLFRDTMGFLTSILIMVGVAALLYGAIYYFFLRPRMGGSSAEMKKYKQAVKQSKMRYSGKSTSQAATAREPIKTAPAPKKKKKRSSAPHLRVIEGHKNKDKDRASN